MNSLLQKIASCFSGDNVQKFQKNTIFLNTPRSFNDQVEFRVFDNMRYFSSEVEPIIFFPGSTNLDVMISSFQVKNQLPINNAIIQKVKNENGNCSIIGALEE